VGEVALGEEHAGQFVEGGGDAGMILGAMDLSQDVQQPFEASASAG